MVVEVSDEAYRILQATVQQGRFANIQEALDESVHLLSGDFRPSEDWLAYADESISEGLADVAAGRTIPAEEFLAELRSRRQKTA